MCFFKVALRPCTRETIHVLFIIFIYLDEQKLKKCPGTQKRISQKDRGTWEQSLISSFALAVFMFLYQFFIT